jgi:hypothetical protein
MRICHLATLLSMTLALTGRTAACQEPDSTLAEILNHWEQASRTIQCLDITFTRYEYDLREQTEERRAGRVYWEATHQGCYKIDGDERLNWDDGGTLWIQPESKSYERFPAWVPALARLEDDPRDRSVWWNSLGWLANVIQRFIIHAIQPPDELLLSTDFDAEAFLQRFDVSLETKGDEILLTVLPRHAHDAEWFSKILICVDADSFAPVGHRRISPTGNNVVSHVFTKVTINETPPDRNELLWPDLHSLRNDSQPLIGVR